MFKIIFSFSLLLPVLSCAQPNASFEKELPEIKSMVEYADAEDQKKIISECWNQFAQPIFWKKIMCLSPDSCVINIAATREIIQTMSLEEWDSYSDEQKDSIRTAIRESKGLDEEARIFLTTGKRDFYRFDEVIPTLTEGMIEFAKNDVDPWYAKSILLIESPGKIRKSRAGAYGPFQLMPKVARAQGLIVSRYKDERADFKRSAFGASQLIKNVCIPEAKKILDKTPIQYKEDELWFKLFVLHVYHAGASNVAAVVNKIQPDEKMSGQDLILKMWQTTAANFGNSSQNYTQLAIAARLIVQEMEELTKSNK